MKARLEGAVDVMQVWGGGGSERVDWRLADEGAGELGACL